MKEIITITREQKIASDTYKQLDEQNKGVIFKKCTPNCLSRMNNNQIDNAEDLDIVIPM